MSREMARFLLNQLVERGEHPFIFHDFAHVHVAFIRKGC
jgi:hypothetical protein